MTNPGKFQNENSGSATLDALGSTKTIERSYSKIDFVPGDKASYLLMDFSNDFIGRLPLQWNPMWVEEVLSVNGIG